jgi:hypothetical protein
VRITGVRFPKPDVRGRTELLLTPLELLDAQRFASVLSCRSRASMVTAHWPTLLDGRGRLAAFR